MSGATRTTPSTRRRSARRWGGRTCASWRCAAVENQAATDAPSRARTAGGQSHANAERACAATLAEIGVVAAQGAQHAYALKRLLTGWRTTTNGADRRSRLPCARPWRRWLIRSTRSTREIEAIDDEIKAQVKADDTGAAADDDPRASGRSRPRRSWPPCADTSAFASPAGSSAAFLGLTPRQNATGGKERLGRHHQDGRPLLAQAAWWSGPARR